MKQPTGIDKDALCTSVCPVCETVASPQYAATEWTSLHDGPHMCSAKCNALFWDNHYDQPDAWKKCVCQLCVQTHDEIACLGLHTGAESGFIPPSPVAQCTHDDCHICERRGYTTPLDAAKIIRMDLEREINELLDLPLRPASHNALVINKLMDAPRPWGIPVFMFMLENPQCPCGRWPGSPAPWWRDGVDVDLCDCTS